MKLKNQVALVTGSGNFRGIGCGVALEFAKEGAIVVIHSLPCDKEDALKVVEEMKSMGCDSILVTGDISKNEELSAMYSDILNRYGRIDIVVNNAGVCVWEKTLDISEAAFKKIVSVNLKGTIESSRIAARIMVEKEIKGKIINIASCHARRPCPNMAVYGATKAGMDQFSRSLAFELAPYGIRVNQIWPGLVETDINNAKPEMASQAARAHLLETIPLQRVATTQDVGEAAVYLASDDSKAVSGEMIKIDSAAFIRCLM